MTDHAQKARRFVESLEARDWAGWAALMSPDVVYEMPQTDERIVGLEKYLEFNRTYPGKWSLSPKVVIGDESHAVVWFGWTLEGESGVESGVESGDAQAFFDFDGDGLITRVTDFWPEPYVPPERPAGLIDPMEA